MSERTTRNINVYKEDADWLYVNRRKGERIREVLERLHKEHPGLLQEAT